MWKKILTVLTVVVLFGSCKPETYTNHQEYLNALGKTDELRKAEQHIDDVNVVCEWIPKELYAMQGTKNLGENFDTLAYQAKFDAIKNEVVMKWRLSTDGHGVLGDSRQPDQAYFSRLEYFTSYAQYDMKLIQGTDTLLCSNYHFERFYDAAPFNTVISSFTAENFALDKDFIVQFSYPFVEGKALEFEYDIDNIKKLPGFKI